MRHAQHSTAGQEEHATLVALSQPRDGRGAQSVKATVLIANENIAPNPGAFLIPGSFTNG